MSIRITNKEVVMEEKRTDSLKQGEELLVGE